MILFISNYPDKEGEKDGMMQRVVAVDRHFADRERVYLGIRFFGNLRRRMEKLSDKWSVHKVNFFLHFVLILRLAFRARGIYVHSIHNGFRALPLYLCGNIITDLHGVFPEELGYYGKKTASALYGVIERIATRRSRAVIVVTDAMADHLRAKYGDFPAAIYTIPIFDDFSIGRKEMGGASDTLVAIYSGGSQKWQNIDLMMEAMARSRHNYSFVVLTPDVPFFERKAAEYGLAGRVKVLTVRKSDVYEHYLRADLGFVLRDDSVVNRAACPTKLVEYLACGVIPIVLQPNIGDFSRRGYAWIGLEQFISGDLPPREELEAKRVNNYRLLRCMRESADEMMRRMVAEFTAAGDGYGTAA
jgi:glycosyltransferase involved in cell wall biosynthesis